MSCFASYTMPLWYSFGIKEEHLAVLKSGGLFDTSHMAVLFVKGADAETLLQKILQDPAHILPGMLYFSFKGRFDNERTDDVFLTDGKREIKVEIREDIRPDRTARVAMKSMLCTTFSQQD